MCTHIFPRILSLPNCLSLFKTLISTREQMLVLAPWEFISSLCYTTTRLSCSILGGNTTSYFVGKPVNLRKLNKHGQQQLPFVWLFRFSCALKRRATATVIRNTLIIIRNTLIGNSAFDLGGYTVDLTSALFSFFSVNHAIKKKPAG